MPTLSGLDRLVADKFAALRGKRIALLAHAASVDKNLNHILDLCLKHDLNVVKIFAPEHGFFATAQYMEPIEEQHDKKDIPIISLYGNTKESLYLQPTALNNVDILLCDLQDVGSRYYTYVNTIIYALKACAETGVLCMVVDRPNPLNGNNIEGNKVLPKFKSFVGELAVPNRHGLTLGELVLHAARVQNISAVEIIHMTGWHRGDYFSDTGLPWVMPSPNMPTEDTALVYPGGCLYEGTNLSEGRGTTKPFEIIGAPYIDDPYKFAALISEQSDGVTLRPLQFTPAFQKFAGQTCGGVQLHVTDRKQFQSLRTGVAVIWAARQFPGFSWRSEAYEFVDDILAIDLLFGDDQPRLILEKGGSVNEVMAHLRKSEREFESDRASMTIYRD